MDASTQYSVQGQNKEINELLQQFPLDDANISSSLTRLENDITAIRSKMDNAPRKMTLIQLSAKIDHIINILVENGFIIPDEIIQTSSYNKK